LPSKSEGGPLAAMTAPAPLARESINLRRVQFEIPGFNTHASYDFFHGDRPSRRLIRTMVDCRGPSITSRVLRITSPTRAEQIVVISATSTTIARGSSAGRATTRSTRRTWSIGASPSTVAAATTCWLAAPGAIESTAAQAPTSSSPAAAPTRSSTFESRSRQSKSKLLASAIDA